jgi:lipopolysaccharide/colanic/teichoic acid biosynthesis glycosyltransferase
MALLAPVLVALALAIKLDSRGSVFFIQERAGRDGKPFGLIKFRTMHPCTEARSEWVMDNIDRITRLGRWLRRFRLDELPQLVNVLRGEMNLIGPRPPPTSNHAVFMEHIAYYGLRSTVRPGVTGWAQVRYGYANNLDEETEKMRYDPLLDSNRLQVQHAIDRIVETERKRIGLLGLSFKAGTDDLREAPMVILAEALLGKGLTLAIYDRNVSLARLVGTNKLYIEKQIPHLSRHLCESIDELLDRSDVIVVGNSEPEFADAVMRAGSNQLVIDLVRLPLDVSRVRARYDGICWS